MGKMSWCSEETKSSRMGRLKFLEKRYLLNFEISNGNHCAGVRLKLCGNHGKDFLNKERNSQN